MGVAIPARRGTTTVAAVRLRFGEGKGKPATAIAAQFRLCLRATEDGL